MATVNKSINSQIDNNLKSINRVKNNTFSSHNSSLIEASEKWENENFFKSKGDKYKF